MRVVTLVHMQLKLLLLLSLLMPFCCFAQLAQQYDVVIDEMMVDPTPQVSLPNAEFIEIKNTSGRSLNLSGWKLTTSTSTSGAFPNYNLPADSFLIITSTSNASLFSSFAKAIGISSFPALDNNGTTVSLTSKEGRIIHAVAYTFNWYQNAVKQNGGWTLEMKDTKNPCTGMSNWKASTDASGGTPGRKNSVDGLNTDQTPPQLIRTYSLDSTTFIAVFDEPLDSLSAATIADYSLPNLSIVSAIPQSPLFNQVVIKLSSPLQKQTVYNLTVSNVKDCKGNTIGVRSTSKVGWAEEALANDVVINEILFNPKPDAYDYAEVYNRSNKIIDANKLYIANRSATGALTSIQKLSDVPFYIFPGDYIVVTEDAFLLQQQYFVSNPFQLLEISLPSFPDDKGDAVLTNSQGNVVDEVVYSGNWQFALIGNSEGIALERINPDDSSQKQSNWHSAASTAGYGTPTYKNSQYKQTGIINAVIDVTPKIFSPDNDGRGDIATISYRVEQSGYVGNIIIFDASGRMVRYFVKNALLGLQGSWNWDGLDEKMQKLPIGTYIIYTEIYNLQGKKQQFKNTVVLARRLN